MKTRWWIKNGNSVFCGLCFRGCNITLGNAGKCGVRFNDNGTLISPWLGRFCACAIDPIEKKPLYHWRPGSFIYSVGSIGCNMDCPFCQNHRIAHPDKFPDFNSVPEVSPVELVRNIAGFGLDAVAFTYNEPTLQAEYICEAAPLLHEAGIAIVLVTNGLMSYESAVSLTSCVDAANIDLKAFNSKVYKKLGGCLEAVKHNIKLFVTRGIHIELTNLVVPGLNESAEEFIAMVNWIASISPEIPLHITRYFPARNYNEPPTDIEFLHFLELIARGKLKYVHIGNV